MSNEYDEKTKATAELAAEDTNSNQGEMINASGHKQELERNFSLLSICAVAVTTGNTWIAQGGSVVTALSNGGLAGTIYELYVLSPHRSSMTFQGVNVVMVNLYPIALLSRSATGSSLLLLLNWHLVCLLPVVSTIGQLLLLVAMVAFVVSLPVGGIVWLGSWVPLRCL